MTASRPWRRGTYAPLAARYYEDDAVIRLSSGAELLYVRSLAFCASSMSDGFVSDLQVQTFAKVGTQLKRSCTQLVTNSLWVRDEARGGYWVRSWLKWNPSVEQIRAGQAADAARKRGKQSGRNPAGKQDRSSRIPAGFRPTDTDTDTDTESSTRPPAGSGRVEATGGRSPSSPGGAPRPPVSVLKAVPPDLSGVRAQLRSASESVKSRAGRRPEAFAELVRRAGTQPPQSDSAEQK